MTAKHTPGPWGIIIGEAGPVVFSGENGDLVSRMGSFLGDDEAMANARLIAAAPDLLEALQMVVTIANEAYDHWDADHDAKVGKILIALSGASQRYDKRIDAIHSAIAKATGEQK